MCTTTSANDYKMTAARTRHCVHDFFFIFKVLPVFFLSISRVYIYICIYMHIYKYIANVCVCMDCMYVQVCMGMCIKTNNKSSSITTQQRK